MVSARAPHAKSKPAPIPEPSKLPVLKHLHHIDVDKPTQSMMRLAQDHGPLYRLQLPGKSFLVVTDAQMAAEVCDTSRFSKKLPAPLLRLRPLAGDALFTAHNDEPNWGKAHRILMPAFSQDAMQGYFDRMLDVGLQMADKWARLQPGDVVDVPGDMTRLTLDVIALCGFDYRLNSFYDRQMHPFVDAMVDALDEAGRTDNRPARVNALMLKTQERFNNNVSLMHDLVDGVIAERRRQEAAGPGADGAGDLLGLMLHAKDPLTGEPLDDENIRNQVVTFLIAGHETTSSLLSFALYYLLDDDDAMRKAVAEVDRVVGPVHRLPTSAQMHQLTYIEQVLKEALRLWSPAPAFVVGAHETCLLGDKYEVTPDDDLVVLLGAVHRDPSVWNAPNTFDPDRFSVDNEARIPPHAYKPFGNGMRACIGRQFAMQEAKLTLALLLQRFTFARDGEHVLDVRETLTLKPADFHMHVRLRDDVDMASLLQRTAPVSSSTMAASTTTALPKHGGRLAVGYGSNMGSTQQFAERLGREGELLGYDVDVRPLDGWVDAHLKSFDAFVVMSASYNGHPPDNAAAFVDWLGQLDDDALAHVNYAVFGCGHRDWAATFQAVPQRIDQRMADAGARRLTTTGEGDAKGDIAAAFASWATATWPAVHDAAGVDVDDDAVLDDDVLHVELVPTPTPVRVPDDAVPFALLEKRELVNLEATVPTGKAPRSKLHLSFKLPDGVVYNAGDHLVVMPENSADVVDAYAQRLGWDLEQVVQLAQDRGRTWPVGRPLSLRALLTRHVELQAPVRQTQLRTLLTWVRCPPETGLLQRWLDDDSAFTADVSDKGLMLLDVLQRVPSVRPTPEQLLPLLAPLAPRTYSISSSPRQESDEVHLTVAVLRAPARRGEGLFAGVCSNHLAQMRVGDRVLAAVRTPTPAFAPPSSTTPAIFVSAGTGFAPFRGFLQERAAQAQQDDVDVADTLVFSGCDAAHVDLLYPDDHAGWSDVMGALFFAAESEVGDDVRFVQDRLWMERERVLDVVTRGGAVYLCGDGRFMAPAVRQVMARILGDDVWQQFVDDGRYFEDAWAG